MRYVKLFILVFVLFLIPSFASAIIIERADIISLQGDVTDNVLGIGQRIESNATVTGDFLAAAAEIFVGNNVNGDILAAASTIDIKGDINGDIRVAGQDISIKSLVRGDVMALGKRIVIAKGSIIDGDVVVIGNELRLDGDVSGRVIFKGNKIIINSSINKDVSIEAKEIEITDNAVINGKLSYKKEKEQTFKGIIRGGTYFSKEFRFEKSRQYATGAVLSFIIMLIIGLIILNIFPKRSFKVTEFVYKRFWISLLVGILVFIVVPIILIVLLITIIGIPIALLLLVFYLILLYLANIFVAAAVGWVFFRKRKKKEFSLSLNFVVGLAVVAVITFAIGWFSFALRIGMTLAIVITGIGAMTLYLFERRQKK